MIYNSYLILLTYWEGVLKSSTLNTKQALSHLPSPIDTFSEKNLYFYFQISPSWW